MSKTRSEVMKEQMEYLSSMFKNVKVEKTTGNSTSFTSSFEKLSSPVRNANFYALEGEECVECSEDAKDKPQEAVVSICACCWKSMTRLARVAKGYQADPYAKNEGKENKLAALGWSKTLLNG